MFADLSCEDVATYRKTDHNKHVAAAGLMGEVVELSTSKLTSPEKDVLAAGGAIYQYLCCLPSTGRRGRPKCFPDLTEAATVKAKDPTTVLWGSSIRRANHLDRSRADWHRWPPPWQLRRRLSSLPMFAIILAKP